MRIDDGAAVRLRLMLPPIMPGQWPGPSSWSRTSRRSASSSAATCSETATRRSGCARGEEALVELERHPVRIVAPRHRPAGHGRVRGLPRDARALAGPDPDADRARRGARPRRRARGRRRRLPDEAVLAARARGADEGDPAAHRAARAATTCSRSATSSSTASRTTSPSTGEPVELTAKEFDLLAFFLANAGMRRSRATSCSTASGASSTRAARDRRRPRRAAAPQARPARPDPHAPRRRVQGRRAVKTPAGAAVRGDARRARR